MGADMLHFTEPDAVILDHEDRLVDGAHGI